MLGTGTNAFLVVRKMQDEYRDKRESCTRVLWMLRRLLIEVKIMGWTMRIKVLPKVM